jgi:GDP/UDP-N,N'-diacetylbacillosamine 2-epimerase (hydrolysing)
MKVKVCVVTGTRAEFGLLKSLLGYLEDSKLLQLQLVVTGSHLSLEFGNTIQEVQKYGIVIDYSVDMLLSSTTKQAVSKAIGLGQIGFTDAYLNLNPDLLIVLGDRFELLSAAIPALIMGIPIAHIHGGEVTTGAIDDSIRHALTKFACLHFVATESYRNRVIQMGENEENVHCVGGLGVDAIRQTALLTKQELETVLGLKFDQNSLLVTFHAETRDSKSPRDQVKPLLTVLSELENTTIIFTAPNADPGGLEIADAIKEFISSKGNCFYFDSLGITNYLSCIRCVDGVVGNSSSGLAEVPSLKKGSLNIGGRQSGRSRAESVLDCENSVEGITAALTVLQSDEHQEMCKESVNPYGTGGASLKILSILESVDFTKLKKKAFVDLPII